MRSSDDLNSLWLKYVVAHQQVRGLDTNGRWDDAVALTTTKQAQGTTTTFGEFDEAVTQMRNTASQAAITKLGGIGGGTPWAIAIGLASLVAAWLVVRGFGQRIEEYR